MRLEAAIAQYLEHLRERGCTGRTCSSYQQELDLFRRFLAESGVVEVERVCREHVAGFLARTAKGGRAVCPATRNRKLIVLRGFFRILVAQKAIGSSPTEGVPWARQPPVERPALSQGDVERLLRAVGPTSGWRKVRDEALVTLLFHTGLRLDEATALDAAQADLSARLLLGVRRKGGGTQPIPLNRTATEALHGWLAAREAFCGERQVPALFVSRLRRRLSRRAVELLMRKLGQRAGFAFPVAPHMLRHAFATALLKTGANLEEVRRLLGHRSIVTTSRYSHPDQASLRSAVDRLAKGRKPPEP